MQPSYAVIAIGLSAVVVLSPFKATAQTSAETNSSSRDREEAAVEEAAKLSIDDDKPLPEAETAAVSAAEVQVAQLPAEETAKATLDENKPLPEAETAAAVEVQIAQVP
ncbi:MAG: hypothetical protein F6K28_47785, partial [Microcoleus sp. SIO2G3]|nr:hypothetical protein [Microcoleus sp. SIO2G3]